MSSSSDSDITPQNASNNTNPSYVTSEDEIFMISPGVSDNEEQKPILIRRKQKSWFQKTFGPMKKGSLRGSIFVLMATALGAGALAIPHMYVSSGLVLGVFFTIFCAVLARVALHLLVYCSMKTNISRYSKLGAGKALQICIIVYCFGILLSYQILIAQFLSSSLVDFGVSATIANADYLRYIINAAVAILTFPLDIQKDFGSLRYVSIFGFITLVYLILVVIFETPWYIKEFWNPDQVRYFIWDWNILVSYSICLFAYTCFQVVFQIREELENPKPYRLNKIFDRSVLLEFMIYIFLGLCGYVSTLGDTPDIILSRKTLPGTKRDYPIIIGRIGMLITLFFAIPINLNPGRACFSLMIKKKEYYNQKTHLCITLGFVIFSTAIAMVYPKIIAAISFLGGACSILIGVTFPGLCFVKVNDYKWNSFFNLFVIFSVIVLTIAGYAAAIISLLVSFGAIKI